MKKYQQGFIGWMIPALYGILAVVGGVYAILTGNITEKAVGGGILILAIITFAKMKKHILTKKEGN